MLVPPDSITHAKHHGQTSRSTCSSSSLAQSYLEPRQRVSNLFVIPHSTDEGSSGFSTGSSPRPQLSFSLSPRRDRSNAKDRQTASTYPEGLDDPTHRLYLPTPMRSASQKLLLSPRKLTRQRRMSPFRMLDAPALVVSAFQLSTDP